MKRKAAKKARRARQQPEPPASTARAAASPGGLPAGNSESPDTTAARAAFINIQLWLAHLMMDSAAEYAEKKNPAERSLQNGQAWSALLSRFGLGGGPKGGSGGPGATMDHAAVRRTLGELVAFARCSHPLGGILSEALHAFSIELDSCGGAGRPEAAAETPITAPLDQPGPGGSSGEAAFTSAGAGMAKGEGESGAVNCRPASVDRPLERLCSWLDAAIHLSTHSYWHHAPICFDPDPEKRELAAAGLTQRHFARQTDYTKSIWQFLHSEWAEKFKDSAKWAVVGRAMASEDERPWTYQEIDTLIIYLWPLLQRHNWTYRDLLNVVRAAASRPEAYPCRSQNEFSTYCIYVLGLRKSGRGKSAASGQPAGGDVARRLCEELRNGELTGELLQSVR